MEEHPLADKLMGTRGRHDSEVSSDTDRDRMEPLNVANLQGSKIQIIIYKPTANDPRCNKMFIIGMGTSKRLKSCILQFRIVQGMCAFSSLNIAILV